MAVVTMYGADWCGDCRRSKRLLDALDINYEYIDVEADEVARERAVQINGGRQSIPVITFPDGTHLTEPSDPDLRAKLGALDLIPGDAC